MMRKKCYIWYFYFIWADMVSLNGGWNGANRVSADYKFKGKRDCFFV